MVAAVDRRTAWIHAVLLGWKEMALAHAPNVVMIGVTVDKVGGAGGDQFLAESRP